MSVSKKLRYDLNLALQTVDITMQQFSVLQHIEQLAQHQDVSAVDIVCHLDMDKPTISGILSRLEKKELITKETNQKDKRLYNIILNEKGLLKLKNCKIIADHVLNKFLKPISNAEQQSLINILSKLNIEK